MMLQKLFITFLSITVFHHAHSFSFQSSTQAQIRTYAAYLTTRTLGIRKSSEKPSNEGEIPQLKKNDRDETYFELSPKRRVTVCKWDGNARVDIREYYESKNGGKMLPGRKGLSLTMEQYKIMRDLIQDGTVDDMISELENEE